MRKFFKNFVICLIIIFIGTAVFYFFTNSRPIATAKQETTDLPVVDTYMLSSKNYLSNIKSYGEIVSKKKLDIRYRDKGKVIRIGENIDNGAYIKKGDLIFQIDVI